MNYFKRSDSNLFDFLKGKFQFIKTKIFWLCDFVILKLQKIQFA
jgi:hypothetical protein